MLFSSHVWFTLNPTLVFSFFRAESYSSALCLQRIFVSPCLLLLSFVAKSGTADAEPLRRIGTAGRFFCARADLPADVPSRIIGLCVVGDDGVPIRLVLPRLVPPELRPRLTLLLVLPLALLRVDRRCCPCISLPCNMSVLKRFFPLNP